MQITSVQRNFVVTNCLMSRSFKDVQQLFEQHFRNGVSPTKLTIWKDIKKYKTERSSININNDCSDRKSTTYTEKH